jgi:hypothetical protein
MRAAMKLTRESVASFGLNLAGVVIFSQAISFSRWSKWKSIETLINRHAELLAAAGIGLLCSFILIRSLTGRIEKLEAVVASRGEGPTER